MLVVDQTPSDPAKIVTASNPAAIVTPVRSNSSANIRDSFFPPYSNTGPTASIAHRPRRTQVGRSSKLSAARPGSRLTHRKHGRAPSGSHGCVPHDRLHPRRVSCRTIALATSRSRRLLSCGTRRVIAYLSSDLGVKVVLLCVLVVEVGCCVRGRPRVMDDRRKLAG